jgi:hypothetical protein
MGMTYEQYWEQSPYLVAAYRKAYRLKREADNEQAWLQGLYTFDAFAVCLANVFAKRGAKKQVYIERPIDIFPLSESEKKRREAEEYEKMQKAMEAMMRKQQREKKSKG